MKRIELEGDFSEFVDVYTTPGKELSSFIDLAPDLMEILLTRATNFTIELLNSHIYITFRESHVVSISAPQNSHITPSSHESILQLGLEVGKKLAIATRPDASMLSIQRARPLRLSDFRNTFLWSIGPVIVACVMPFLVPFLLVYSLIVLSSRPSAFITIAAHIMAMLTIFLPALCVIILMRRYRRQAQRADSFHTRYGTAQIDR